MMPGIGRRLLGEFLGTAFLVAAVIGSGIMASRLSPNDIGLQLLENAAATAAALVAIILAIGPVSGAHLNPVVTLADRLFGGLSSGEAAGYIGAQLSGGAAGAVMANLMFSLPAVEVSTKVRSSGGLWFAEVVATFGLLLVVFGVLRSGRARAAPFAVGAYIGGAYFFTASTSFANPAVTAARMFSNTFAGIGPSSVPPFVVAQLVGAALAVLAVRVLYPGASRYAADVVLPTRVIPQATELRRQGGDEMTPVGSTRFLPPTSARTWRSWWLWSPASSPVRPSSAAWPHLSPPLVPTSSTSSRSSSAASPGSSSGHVGQAQGGIVKEVPEVLFVCVHNAGRSQMAAALLDHHAQGRVHVHSGGSAPGQSINPAVAEAMAEMGLDLSKEFPKRVTDEAVRAADVVITMGCGDACPIYPGTRYEDWALDDPKDKSVEEVRPIRDEIDRRVLALMAELTSDENVSA
jgi:arsenate reductase